MTGCSDEPDPAAAAADVEASRTAVQEAMRAVAETAATAGLDLPAATGSWSVCSAEPLRMKYAAGGPAAPRGSSVAEAVAALTDALEQDGWNVENAGTDPEPYANLTRDDLRASLGKSRRTPGAVSVGVTGPCVAATQEQEALLGESDRVLG